MRWLRSDRPRDVIPGDVSEMENDLPEVTWESTASVWRTDPRLLRQWGYPGPLVDWTWAEAMPPIVGGPDAVFPAANFPELREAMMRDAFEHPSTSSSSWSDGPSSDDGGDHPRDVILGGVSDLPEGPM